MTEKPSMFLPKSPRKRILRRLPYAFFILSVIIARILAFLPKQAGEKIAFPLFYLAWKISKKVMK
jgi:hypothetical protein